MKFHAKQALGVLRPRRKSKRRRARSKIDELPDAILTHILSQLEDARFVAVAATVCKRWKECSRHVQVLRLLDRTPMGRDALGWVSLIKRTSGLRELEIESLGYPLDFNKEYFVRLCLIHASPGLEVLDLSINLNLSLKFFDNIALFGKLQALHLDNTEPVHFSAGSTQFSRLKKCSLCTFKMTDNDLEEFLDLCPVLEELDVLDCERFEALVMTSKSLRKLRFSSSAGSVQIVAPNLTKLSVGMVDDELICETDLLEELTVVDSVKASFRNLANLRFLDIACDVWLEDMLLDLLQQARAAKQVVLGAPAADSCRPSAERIFGSLQQVERLELLGDRYQEFLYPEKFCFPKLKDAILSLDYPDGELTEFIVRSAPGLKYLRLHIGEDGGRPSLSYFRTLLRLQAAFPALSIDLQTSRPTFWTDGGR